jgi:tetratricopeptide (TPR) repeat protein
MAFNNRGLAYASKGNADRAMADYNEAIRLNPNLAMAFNNRGLAYASKGDYDQALVDFNEAIRLDPNLSNAFLNRGFSYSKKGDKDRAIADYNEAVRLANKATAVTLRQAIVSPYAIVFPYKAVLLAFVAAVVLVLWWLLSNAYPNRHG